MLHLYSCFFDLEMLPLLLFNKDSFPLPSRGRRKTRLLPTTSTSDKKKNVNRKYVQVPVCTYNTKSVCCFSFVVGSFTFHVILIKKKKRKIHEEILFNHYFLCVVLLLILLLLFTTIVCHHSSNVV